MIVVLASSQSIVVQGPTMFPNVSNCLPNGTASHFSRLRIEFSSSTVHNFVIGVVRRTVGDIIGLEENYEVFAAT